MTIKEAINLLDNLLGMVDDNQNSDYDQALHMGIDALKAEPYKPDDFSQHMNPPED